MTDQRFWLWIFAEIEGLRWVLKRNQMAFAEHAGSRILNMGPGDRAILYTTRRVFHNPNDDESRLAGIVDITAAPQRGKAIEIAGRRFVHTVDFAPKIILPERRGPEMRPLAARLDRVKRPEVWGQYFRYSPIELSKKDFTLLERAVVRWSKKEL